MCNIHVWGGGGGQESPFQTPTKKNRNYRYLTVQHAKKVVSDNPGLVDFAIGLVIFSLARPASAFFWGEFKLQKDCNQSC